MLIFTAISEDMAKQDGGEGGDEDLEREELGGKIINYKPALLLLQKGYLQKYGNMKGVISSSNWDGEEGGDEDVEQEEELGGGGGNYNYYLLLLQKN